MRITVLMDDTAKNDSFLAEHGLSFYIETQQHRILFDMGQSNAFIENANRLHVDLSTVDIAILSHGHYDHGGGLAAVWLHFWKSMTTHLSISIRMPLHRTMRKTTVILV